MECRVCSCVFPWAGVDVDAADRRRRHVCVLSVSDGVSCPAAFDRATDDRKGQRENHRQPESGKHRAQGGTTKEAGFGGRRGCGARAGVAERSMQKKVHAKRSKLAGLNVVDSFVRYKVSWWCA